MSFKTASQATLTFLSARRRIEGGLKSLGKKSHKAEQSKGMLRIDQIFDAVFKQLKVPKHY